MNRQRIRDIRHQEFIQAAILATHRKGFAAVTMTDIATATNSTAASINYYFGSKENLMAATMRYLLERLKQTTQQHLAAATTPQQRLEAIINANFDESLYTHINCNVWVQFWSHSPYSTQLARLHNINRARVRSYCRAELKQLVNAERIEIVRKTLQAYMDGVWIQASQSEQPLNPKQAQAEARQVLDLLISSST